VATGGNGKKRDAEKASQRAAVDLRPEQQANASSDAAAGSDDQLITVAQIDDATPAGDEPRRRPTARAASSANVPAESAPSANSAAVAAVLKDGAPATDGKLPASADAAEGLAKPSAKLTASKSEALLSVLGRAPSGGAATHRAAGAAGEEELPRVDPARFIGRVAKAFQTAHERGGTLQLRLSPPELGSLRLELTVKDGVMTAVLETETTAARRVLLDHLPALRDRLAEQNIRVERFDVDVRRDGGGSQADDRAAQHQQQQPDQPPPRRPAMTQSQIGEPAPRETTAVNKGNNDTQINLVA
jgi:flagellar hook-length control protein FliK